jgi:thiamine-phosphate pyrophosphorylase
MEMIATCKAKITGGVYLVLDPAVEQRVLLAKLETALKGSLQVVQIWNNWQVGSDKLLLISAISKMCKIYRVPLLINEEWELLQQTADLDGVHFDIIPHDLDAIRRSIARPFITGITCSGDLDTVAWAQAHQLDYISFCAMYPSPSAGTCNIVMPETVSKAREITAMPIFVSGGITPQNTSELKQQIPFDGIAVISGVLSADDPEQIVREYHLALTTQIK